MCWSPWLVQPDTEWLWDCISDVTTLHVSLLHNSDTQRLLLLLSNADSSWWEQPTSSFLWHKEAANAPCGKPAALRTACMHGRADRQVGWERDCSACALLECRGSFPNAELSSDHALSCPKMYPSLCSSGSKPTLVSSPQSINWALWNFWQYLLTN